MIVMGSDILTFAGTGALAGLIGSMLGLGGGIIIVPVLTLILGVDMKLAISASLISLVATSSMSVLVYAEKEMIHYRLGLFLALATVMGSFSGSYLAIILRADILMLVFALIQLAAVGMLYRRNFCTKPDIASEKTDSACPRQESFFSVTGETYSETTRAMIPFYGRRIGLGFVISVFAGMLSGMLGVGGGVLQVPTMNAVCKIPVKESAATSAFMIGITGLAGALIFFLFGKTDLVLTGSLVLGIFAGAYAGAHWAVKIRAKTLTGIMMAVLLASAIRFVMKATGL